MHWLPELDSQFWWWVAGLSLFWLVLSVVLAAWVLVRIPADYFIRDPAGRPLLLANHPALRWILRVISNIVGAVLILAGIAMLALPGQGILTIVVGLMMISVPGKQKIVHRFLAARAVHRPINALRRRAGRAPIQIATPDRRPQSRHQ